jgi:hypothetical protein
MSIAKTWSGGEVTRTWSDENDSRLPYYDDQSTPSYYGADMSPPRMGGGALPRPDIVKRDTSHQNESYETKPSVKRAALNRDNSLASNRLKKEFMPEYYGTKIGAEQEMTKLSSSLEHSTLSTGAAVNQPKPQPLGEDGRVSTMDAITMDLMVKPQPLLEGNRMR